MSSHSGSPVQEKPSNWLSLLVLKDFRSERRDNSFTDNERRRNDGQSYPCSLNPLANVSNLGVSIPHSPRGDCMKASPSKSCSISKIVVESLTPPVCGEDSCSNALLAQLKSNNEIDLDRLFLVVGLNSSADIVISSSALDQSNTLIGLSSPERMSDFTFLLAWSSCH